jgi:tetratricopeptide (TPR) repeat protein
VKVLDFGVAKMTMMEGDDSSAEEKLTKAGRIFGTPMYMAPEQACAEPITPATDVYALGLLIFEMLTGLPPVTGRNRMDVIHKQIRDPVPVLTKELEGTALGDFIRTATEKKPSDRFADASAMIEGLLKALRAMNIHPRARGATHPEISVTSLVPETLPEDEPLSGPVPSAPSAPSSAPKPPPLPPNAPAAADEAPDMTAQRPSLTSRLAEKERKKREFGDRPHSKPRYELRLIGRDQDVIKLGEVVKDNAFARSGHILSLEGEAGIGKSRVVSALKSSLRNVGVDVCVGHCRKRSLPLEPIREALADLWSVSHAERMQVDKTVRSDLIEMGGYTDEEIDFLVDFVRPRAAEEAQVDPKSEEAGVLFAQLERVILGIAERKPLVLALEDLQNADSGTLGFLEYFAVTLRTQPAAVVVLMTLRPEERALNPNLERSLRTIGSNIGAGLTRHPLRRLRGRDLSRLLDAILPLEQRLKERVGWLSQGVPLHALQIVRYLQNGDSLEKKEKRWGLKSGSPREIELPPDLMDLMRLRIEQALSKHSERPSLKATLEWLATLGMRTPVELLGLVLGGTNSLDEDLSVLREEGIVKQALHHNLICVEFDNTLLREAILKDLSERWASRRLHASAASKKVEFYRSKGLEVPLIEIAEHWRQAGEIDRYREVIFASANRAMQRGDHRGARDQFRELGELLESEDDYGSQWVDVQYALAELAWRLGEYGLAEDHFTRAIDQAKGNVDASRGLRGLGHLAALQGRHDRAEEHYARALKRSRSNNDGAGVAKALIGLSRVHLSRSDLRSEEPISKQLTQILPNLPDGSLSGKVLVHLAEVARRRGQLDKRLKHLVEARKQFEAARDRQGLSDCLLSLGSALMDPAMNAHDRVQEAGRVLKQALELKRRLGDRFGVAEAFRYLGQFEMEQENYDQAESLLGQALTIHEALNLPYYVGATYNGLAVVRLYRRDHDGAVLAVERALETFKRIGDLIAASHAMMNLGEILINKGDIARAQTMLREARRTKESMGSSWAMFDIRNHLALVSMWLGEFDDAERILSETLQNVDEAGTGEDRAVARSLLGMLRCFQSRLQLAALELGRSRADAEDLGIDRVTSFCQANAAFYASLTEADSSFEQLVNALQDKDFFYTLERGVWLEWLDKVVRQVADREENRQSVRLLHTAARFWRVFGNDDRYQALVAAAKDLDARVNARRRE